jgi:hypothetical protein
MNYAMNPIPLIKRILYYFALFPIGLIVAYFFVVLLNMIFGMPVYRMLLIEISIAFLIIHYIFCIIFFKIKLLIKLIIPFALTIFSGIIFWLMSISDFFLCTYFFNGRYDNSIADFIINTFLIFIVLWEIAYQILRFCYKPLNDDEKSPEL